MEKTYIATSFESSGTSKSRFQIQRPKCEELKTSLLYFSLYSYSSVSLILSETCDKITLFASFESESYVARIKKIYFIFVSEKPSTKKIFQTNKYYSMEENKNQKPKTKTPFGIVLETFWKELSLFQEGEEKKKVFQKMVTFVLCCTKS